MVLQYYSNTAILLGDDNRIVKILMKQYYRNIDVIIVLTQKLSDFIVYELKMLSVVAG